MKILRVFTLLLVAGLAQAETAEVLYSDPANGNNLPEPELKDYQSANRAPGILVEPYDIVDQSGKPAEL
jgi:hypothetical protein